jgi:hypothetical protein
MEYRVQPDPHQAGQYACEHRGAPPISLRFNESVHSLRIQSGSDQRVYLLESTPLPFPKVAVFNEYGLRAGSCSFDDLQRLRGSLRWGSQKFKFQQEGGEIVLRNRDVSFRYTWLLAPHTSAETIAGILLTLVKQIAVTA